MTLGRSSRRSFRHTIFIGVLAGSVFSGSGAFAAVGITTQDELEAIGIDGGTLALDYILMSDLILDPPISAASTYIAGTFTGTLDGNGKTLFGLTKPLFDSIGAAININDEDGIPIDTIEVKNLNLGDLDDPVNISGRGALSNSLTYGGTVDNVDVNGDVNGDSYVGGLIGSSNGSINNSSVNGNVTGNSSIGGLVGEFGGTITGSHATGSVSGASYVGGLVGESYGGEITNSHATGNVFGTTNIGGLVGWSESDVTDSHATGDVEGVSNVGGLVGKSYGDVTDSHATGDVEGVSNVGGLVGESQGEITGSWHIAGDVTGEDNVGGLAGYSSGAIRESYATGNVIGSGEYIGGLVGDAYGTIEDSFATGDVTGTGVDDVAFHGIGGLIGYLGGYLNNSYATGVVRGFAEIGGLVGSLGGGAPIISNSHATGDVYGEEFVGGLVGKLDTWQTISNAYATGDVTGWGYYIGGLVGASYGYIQNAYATGDVGGDSYVGGLVGYLYDGRVENSFATGDVAGNSHFDNFIGTEGGSSFIDEISRAFSKSSPDAPSILDVVNTVGFAGAPAFEIVTCKNNGLPLLSAFSASYANTCPVSSNRINGFIQPTLITEIAKALGFVISPKFPNDSSIGFIKNEKELDISKILGVQKAADRVAWTSVKTGEALQISYNFESKDPIELWVKLPDGKWILAGVINFDKNGKAVLPPKQFKVAGEYVLVLNKPSEDSVKANAPLNQIGSLTVFVN